MDALERRVQYTYISIPKDQARSQRIDRLQKYKGIFHAGIYRDLKDAPAIPSFMIIDTRLLILNLPKSNLEDDVCLAIIHGDLVERFEEYFATLEKGCEKIC